MSDPRPRPEASTLPVLGQGGRREQAVLAASRDVLALFLAHGSTEFTIRELAEHAGVSERTFYRYFPRKEDAVRPYLEVGLSFLVERVREHARSQALPAAILEAHQEILGLADAASTARLLTVLTETERLRAVWIQVSVDAEQALAEVVAEQWGTSPDDARARLAAAAVVAAGRLSLETSARTGTSAVEVFGACAARLEQVLATP